MTVIVWDGKTLADDKPQSPRNRLIRLHYETQTGHLGSNLSCLDILLYLHNHIMNDDNIFIMSKGHAAAALYVTLWSMGKITEEELLTFAKDGTKLCGHATAQYNHFSTGSLGHGASLAVGMAIADTNRIVYCLLSDGELSEGSTKEAMDFAYHHSVKNVRFIIDCNGWQGFGKCPERMGYDGHDEIEIEKGFREGWLITYFRTVKGNGMPNANMLESHYMPPMQEEYENSFR